MRVMDTEQIDLLGIHAPMKSMGKTNVQPFEQPNPPN